MSNAERAEAARRQREEALAEFGAGRISARDLHVASRMEDYRALRRLRLWQLLDSRPGWTRKKAEKALARFGLSGNDTLYSVREGSPLTRLEAVLDLVSDRWEGPPEMPPGYPFKAKAADIMLLLVADGMPVKNLMDTVRAEIRAKREASAETIGQVNIAPLPPRDGSDPQSMSDEELDDLFGDADGGGIEVDEVADDLFGPDAEGVDDIADELFGVEGEG